MAHFIIVSTILLNAYILCSSREIFDENTKNVSVISSKADVDKDSTSPLPFGARISKHFLKEQISYRQSQYPRNLTDELRLQRKKIKKRKKIVKMLNQKHSTPLNESVRLNLRPKNKENIQDHNFNSSVNGKFVFALTHTKFNSSKPTITSGLGILKTNSVRTDNFSSRLPLNVIYSTSGPKVLTIGRGEKEFHDLANAPLKTLPTSAPDVQGFDDKSGFGSKLIPDTCSCYWNSQNCGCSCFGSLNVVDFQALSAFFQTCKNFTFVIGNGNYHSFPSHFFANVGHVENFHLTISNASFDYLFDSSSMSSAFQHVSFSKSAMIEISDLRVIQGWNWEPLAHLTSSSNDAVARIEINGCGLNRLSSDFTRIVDGKVTDVLISKSNLHMVGSGAFSDFDHLTHFRVPQNKIRSIKRTDLPTNPVSLLEIDLSDNQISILEPDFFTEMPSLQYITLTGNPLRVISEEVFQTIIGKVNLPGLANFSLNCDCQLKWLKASLSSNNSMILKNMEGVTCKRPPHLRGTPFADLSEEHLVCSG